MSTLTEQERLLLITALKIAVNQFYREAWAIYGPNGVRPDNDLHTTLMQQVDATRELGHKFGDPMD